MIAKVGLAMVLFGLIIMCIPQPRGKETLIKIGGTLWVLGFILCCI